MLLCTLDLFDVWKLIDATCPPIVNRFMLLASEISGRITRVWVSKFTYHCHHSRIVGDRLCSQCLWSHSLWKPSEMVLHGGEYFNLENKCNTITTKIIQRCVSQIQIQCERIKQRQRDFNAVHHICMYGHNLSGTKGRLFDNNKFTHIILNPVLINRRTYVLFPHARFRSRPRSTFVFKR